MVTNKLKRIAVHETVYQQLNSLGSARDSFNDVLVRILKNQPILKKAGFKEKRNEKNYELVDTNLL